MLYNRISMILFYLVCVVSLNACVPAVIIASAAAGGAGSAIISNKRSFHTMQNDHRAATIAQKRLNDDPLLQKQAHISIAVYNEVALLIGQAKTPQARARAYEIVSQTQHISRIYNRITISKKIGYTRRAHDTWITTKVRSALLRKTGLHSNDVKVVTENGIVYLMGHISSKQAELASEAARHIDGVKQVVLVIKYIDHSPESNTNPA